MKNDQTIIVFDGPDRCGKTEMAKRMSELVDIPYFKMETERENWNKGRFKDCLEIDQPYILSFLKQTGHSAIIDRAWPSEYVYSKVYKRETNYNMIVRIDKGFADLGTIVISPYRANMATAEDDDLITRDKYEQIKNMYQEFLGWTECSSITFPVDLLGEDLDREMAAIERGLMDIAATPRGWKVTSKVSVTGGSVVRSMRDVPGAESF